LSICQLFRDNIPQSDSKCGSTILRIMRPQQTPHFSPHREMRCSTTLRGLSKRYKSGNGGAMRKSPSTSFSAATTSLIPVVSSHQSQVPPVQEWQWQYSPWVVVKLSSARHASPTKLAATVTWPLPPIPLLELGLA
jgi:hypothetical protein